jgi:hypothetical protein
MLGFLRGKSGELRVGYQRAARLGKWSARRNDGGNFILDAEAVETDAYWLGKMPIVAHLWVGAHRWVFHAESLSNSGGRIQASLILQK